MFNGGAVLFKQSGVVAMDESCCCGPCVPTISITKTASPSVVELGQVVSWTITITNTANCEMPAGVEIVDSLPEETNIVYVDGTIYGGTTQDTSAAPSLLWTLPAIPAGGTVILGYDTDTLSIGTFENNAFVQSGAPPATASDSVEVIPPQ